MLRLTAIPQAHLQHLRTWRHDEDRNRRRQRLHDLQGTLYINVQQQILADLLGMIEHASRRPVVVPKNFGPLQKLACLDHLLKLRARCEVILAPIFFRAARQPRRVGDREIQAFHQRSQLTYQR